MRSAQRRGLPTNEGFSGFSNFDVAIPYSRELEDALRQPGPRPLVMCHPGHPDAAPAGDDPVAPRRRMEYDALMADRTLPGRIWRPSRSPDGPPVDWANVRL